MCRIHVHFYSSFWKNFLVKTHGPGDFFFDSFKIMSSLSSIVLRLFKRSTWYWWVVAICVFQELGPFQLSCHINICVHDFHSSVVHSIPLVSFWFLQSFSNVPCCITDVGNLCLLPFFFPFVSLARDLSVLLIFFLKKRISFLFPWFSLLFFCFQFYWFMLSSFLFPSFCLFWI